MNEALGDQSDPAKEATKDVKKSLAWFATPFTAHRLSSRCGSTLFTGLRRPSNGS